MQIMHFMHGRSVVGRPLVRIGGTHAPVNFPFQIFAKPVSRGAFRCKCLRPKNLGALAATSRALPQGKFGKRGKRLHRTAADPACADVSAHEFPAQPGCQRAKRSRPLDCVAGRVIISICPHRSRVPQEASPAEWRENLAPRILQVRFSLFNFFDFQAPAQIANAIL